MNNVFVYCELEGTTVAEVSQELLTKGRKLANTLGVQLEAVAAGSGIVGKVEAQILLGSARIFSPAFRSDSRLYRIGNRSA